MKKPLLIILLLIGAACIGAGIALVACIQWYGVEAVSNWIWDNRYAFFGTTSGAGCLGLVCLAISQR